MDINTDKVAQIYELIKHSKPDATLDDALFGYHNVHCNPIIVRAEQEIKPMIDFVKTKPELMWFIDDKRVSVIGQQYAKQIRIQYPDVTLDEYLSMSMTIWKDILMEFVVSHGYV